LVLKKALINKLLKSGSKSLKVKVPIGEKHKEQDYRVGRGSDITPIPDIDDPDIKEIEIYPIRVPYSYARITYNSKKSEYVYEVIEPPLTPKEKELLNLIMDTFEKALEYELDKMGIKDKREYLKGAVNSFIKSRGIKVDSSTKNKIDYYILRNFVDYDHIDALMSDNFIEDISCDGTAVPLFVFHQKYESIKTSTLFEEAKDLDSFVVQLGQRCGKQVSVSSPILDGTSGEGHRVQATYGKEVTTRGSSFTIRRFKEKPFTPVDLIKFNTASPDMVAYMWLAVEIGKSMLIVGGTASGKTATLNAAALFIRPGAKIVTMEDTRELNLPHENWIPGVTRTGQGERDAEGKAEGEIDMYELVRGALRQRPNYIIVGEVRGKETSTMFQAMATGHTTYSTMHADSVKSMINRLENPPINTPRILLTALNFVIIQKHVRVKDSIVRRITEIVELVAYEADTNEIVTNTVYAWDPRSDSFMYRGHSFILDGMMEVKNMTHDEMDAEFRRRVDIINYMVEKDITDFIEISNLIVAYYKAPMETVQKVRDEMGWVEPVFDEDAEGVSELGA